MDLKLGGYILHTDTVSLFPDGIQYIFSSPIVVFISIVCGIVVSLGVYLYFLRETGLIQVFLKNRKLVPLLVIPPHTTEDTLIKTTEFFRFLHTLLFGRTFFKRLLFGNDQLSVEMKLSKRDGIAYLIYVPDDVVDVVTKALKTYLPSCSVSLYDDTQEKRSLHFFTLKKTPYLPLKTYTSRDMSDPIEYVMKLISHLSENDVIRLQCVLSPVSTRYLNKINHFITLLGTTPHEKQIVFFKAYQEDILKKAKQELFYASLRVGIATQKTKQMGILITLKSFFAFFTNGSLQTITKERVLMRWFFRKTLFTKRILSGSKMVLSAEEVASLYHFPLNPETKEDIVVTHTAALPLPIHRKHIDAALLLGNNEYQGGKTPIGITRSERMRHMYIVGGTGTGKSTLLTNLIKQDIVSGNGVCVLDQHGDLIDDVLPRIPNERIKDVIYINPDDIAFPIGLNLLERTHSQTPDEKSREEEFVCESIISLFHKIFGETYTGPRMEYILRNTIYTAFTTENPTLFTIFSLLVDAKFRGNVLKNLKNPDLVMFWKQEFAKAGDYQKVKMISPITNKIGRFLFSPTTRRIIEQKHSTINFDQIMQEKKIVLCNLSKGKIGEDNSEVLGLLIVTKLFLATLRRARLPVEKRPDFYLYLDEFHTFATSAFASILAESRKYHLSVIMAHQTTAQLIDTTLLDIILANVGSIMCFRSASVLDEKRLYPLFQQYMPHHVLANLEPYHFLLKLTSDTTTPPITGVTIKPRSIYSLAHVDEIITRSQQRYGRMAQQNENNMIEKKIEEENTREYIQKEL